MDAISLQTRLEACTSQKHFKTLFREYPELVKESPALVFKRLESAYHLNNDQDFFVSLSAEVLALLDSFPNTPPRHIDALTPQDHTPRPLANVEKDHILYAVRFYDYDVHKAAAALGISEKTVRNKLDLYIGRRGRDSDGTLKMRMLSYLCLAESPCQ
jgi:DNA-binding NtrC family response regulator